MQLTHATELSSSAHFDLRWAGVSGGRSGVITFPEPENVTLFIERIVADIIEEDKVILESGGS